MTLIILTDLRYWKSIQRESVFLEFCAELLLLSSSATEEHEISASELSISPILVHEILLRVKLLSIESLSNPTYRSLS
jgi:hypothetical protein